MYLGENLGVMIDDNGVNPLLGRGGFFRRIAPAVAPAPAPAPVVNLNPSVPVFTNIDNSAFYMEKAAKEAAAQQAAITPAPSPLPAGIKAVDYTATPPKPVDYVKVGLYAVGILGVIMLLSRKRKGR